MINVNIIGSGVAGLCVATELIKKNVQITIIDKSEVPGPDSCSWWAGGMLAPWCEGESTEKIVVELGQESIPWWAKNVQGVVEKGSLVVALSRDQSDLLRFQRRTNNYTILKNEEVNQLEPDLKGKFKTGLFFKKEAHLSPRNSLIQLKKSLKQKGVEFVKKEFDPKLIKNMNDEEAIQYLSSLRQIGRWSAEMILLFTYNRSNIWPLQDIGLLRAISNNYKKKYFPPKSFLNKLYKKFTPYCSVATWYLWRSIDDEPIQY